MDGGALLRSSSAEAINEYLALVEDTESPRVFHIWSLLSASASCLGKNSELRMGAFLSVKPNLYVVLIGPPAIRKSTPINMIGELLAGTSVNFGPSDTGGQRHGIMSALTGLHRFTKREDRVVNGAPVSHRILNPRHPSDMSIYSSELGRIWGTSNRDIADFLIDLYDGVEIDYETKASSTRIQAPLLTLLGATTPSSMATMLPENAATHGVLSRIVFVYGDTMHKEVPIPPDPTEEWYELRENLCRKLQWIDNNRNDFALSAKADSAYRDLYPYKAELQDPRLSTYQGRRANTLLKVAMCIAALRTDTYVIESDVLLAHEFLCMVEPSMHKALESFGRNKAYHGRQVILQFLRGKPNQRAQMADVIGVAASEMTRREAEEVINAMHQNKEITIFGGTVILGTPSNKSPQ